MPQVDRRDFLKLAGASAATAASTACSDPVEKLIPYVIQPEEITPGIPVVYASTCRECSQGCGLHVQTRESRPIKLEGNPAHPLNRGALCARGQASLGRTYHPDRYEQPQRRDGDALAPTTWDEGIALLAEKVAAAGAGTYVLGGDPGPTAGSVIDGFVSAVGGSRVLYDPFESESVREAARAVFGVETRPVFDLSGADLILDFGSDFLEVGDDAVSLQRQLADARDTATHADGGPRLVSISARLSTTASNADEWLPARPGAEGILALAVARAAVDAGATAPAGVGSLLAGADAASAAEKTGVSAEDIQRLGRAIAKGKAVALPPGVAVRSRRATGTASAVLVLNAVAGAVGTRMQLPVGPRPIARYREVLTLIEAMKSGKVKVLLIHDANPLYSLPLAAGFAEALEKVDFVVSFAPLRDETAEAADLVLPDHTPLESWGDVAARPGIRSLVQPSVRPLLDTRALPDTLLDTGRAMGGAVASQLPEGSFRSLLEQAWSDTDFREALKRGGVFEDTPTANAAVAASVSRYEVAEPLLEGDGDLVLMPFPTGYFGDGGGAALPWLQELGDPNTKVAWQPWAEISRGTAERIGVDFGDIVSITTTAGSVELPVFPRGGIRDDVVAAPIGQGHRVGYYASMNGKPRGANIIDALPAATDENGGRAWLTARASLAATGRSMRMPMVQASDNKRGRQLAETISLSALLDASAPRISAGATGEHGDMDATAHGEGHGEDHGGHHEIRREYDAADDAHEDSPYRWGMTIDLDRCTGCNACVAACYMENNIPTVGQEYIERGRSMSWLRIERYVGEGDTDRDTTSNRFLRPDGESLGDSDVRFSPMLCQQCGAAPCESVCPVLATYHNPEGLNGMVYNRCIGTRYCSNNCPYKVRRFNYRDYEKERWPGLLGLMANPDVTVRQQGVMEKCTFCVQRIVQARQPAKDEGRAIRDGEVVTACQQTCPSQAIGFGNLRDKTSVVSKTTENPRGYHSLHVLNTRPGITYLKKVTRGPVEVS